MITFPSNSDLKKLKAFKEPLCVSLYIPLSQDANTNRIAVKNALQQARIALTSAGADADIIHNTLARATPLTLTHGPHNKTGHAIFAHTRLFQHYYTPSHWTPHLVLVQRGFMLGPVLDAMFDNAQYYLLALSHNHILLFEGNHYEIHPIHPRGLPLTIKEALEIEGSPNPRGAHQAAVFGNDAGMNRQMMLVEFFHRINKRLHRFLDSTHAPLIIGGVEYLQPLYRRTNSYPYLLPGGIKGNLERVNLDNLREQAWSIIQALHRRQAIGGRS